MIIGLLMLLFPIAIYLATFPLSGKLAPLLRRIYRIVGGMIVVGGGAISFYLAAYSGDQGGIAAYFFQMGVIVVYASFSILLPIANWLLRKSRCGRQEK